jgi:hypothetical protein
MTRQSTIKAIAGVSAVSAVIAVVLCIHIYIVAKPKADEQTIAMARIDFKQDINQEDADKITAWLYQQKGVDHIFINTKTETVHVLSCQGICRSDSARPEINIPLQS